MGDRRIWKYTLDVGHNTILIPGEPAIIHVGDQDGRIRIWAIVDVLRPSNRFDFLVLGTGQKIPPELKDDDFIGTVTAFDGGEVWHVFFDGKESK